MVDDAQARIIDDKQTRKNRLFVADKTSGFSTVATGIAGTLWRLMNDGLRFEVTWDSPKALKPTKNMPQNHHVDVCYAKLHTIYPNSRCDNGIL